jgi:LysM repeat protein
MKTRRYVVLLTLTVVLLLCAIVVPAASASGLSGAACPPVYYRVVRGDTLGSIAARYGVSVWQLQQWNHISNIDRIYAGSVLVIYPARCYTPRPVPPPKPPSPPKPAPLPGPCTGPGGCTPGVIVPLVPTNACTDQRAMITSPVNGQQVSGWVTITGNATHENFAYYKLEYGAGSNPNTWSWFFGGQWPIWHASLGGLNAGTLPSGTYTVRVVVVDKTGNYPPPCQVTVYVR